MHNHELEPLKGAPSWLVEAWENPERYEGAYSRVVPWTAHEVLKLTCCEATNALFDGLKSMRPTPGGLPAVLESYGTVARDEDGLPYRAWRIERLFPPQCQDLLALARVRGATELQEYKPHYPSSRQRLLPRDTYETLVCALKEEQEYLPNDTDWRVSERIALNMALRTTDELRSAFLHLVEFIRRHQAALDLLTSGNILVNMFGMPVLGDPVYSSDPEVCSHQEAAPLDQGFCAVGWLPTAMSGLKVTLKPFSTGCLDQEEAVAVRNRLHELGLESDVLVYAGREHQRYVSAAPRTTHIWSTPDVAERLRRNQYQAALCD